MSKFEVYVNKDYRPPEPPPKPPFDPAAMWIWVFGLTGTFIWVSFLAWMVYRVYRVFRG